MHKLCLFAFALINIQTPKHSASIFDNLSSVAENDVSGLILHIGYSFSGFELDKFQFNHGFAWCVGLGVMGFRPVEIRNPAA